MRELRGVILRAALRAGQGLEITPDHLAAAGIDARPPGPTLTTRSTTDESPWTAPAPASLVQRLTAITLRVPALQDRAPAHLRALILALLDGHPIREDALDLLVRQPWWGQQAELRAAIAAARRSDSPIDVARLRTVLPGLQATPDLRPIEVLLFPAAGTSGVEGLRGRYAARELILGRVGGRREIDAALARHDDRRAWLDAVAPSGAPACLPLRFIPEASRIQAVIGRDAEGLVLHAAPWARLAVWGAPLTEGGPGAAVSPDAPLALGPGGEVRLVDAAGAPRLTLYVFSGGVAYDDLVPAALARSASVAGETVFSGEAGDRPARRWVLQEAEVRALVQVIASFPGGEFKAWVVEAADVLERRPELARLAAYLRAAPNPADYLGRLFEYEGNEALAPALAHCLAKEGDDRASRLPARLRRQLTRVPPA